MSSSISSLNNLIANSSSAAQQSSGNQALTLEQQLAQLLAQEANQTDTYGPPYVLDLSSTAASYTNGAAGASTATGATTNTSQQQGFSSDLKELGQALQSGNLSEAQSAFASLSQLPGVQSALQNNPNSQFAQAISQIGSALQSGNLGDAQQALSSLQQQVASSASGASSTPHVGGHHHHHHGGGGSIRQAAVIPPHSPPAIQIAVAATVPKQACLLSNIKPAWH